MYGHQKQGIMTLEEAQKEVDRWIKTYGVRYFSELTNMAVLTEEVGTGTCDGTQIRRSVFQARRERQPCR